MTQYNSRLKPVRQVSLRYDPDTASYMSEEDETEVLICQISDLEIERSVALFGDYQTTRKVVRLQQPYQDFGKYVEIDGQRYRILLKKQKGRVVYVEVASNEHSN